MLSEQPSIFSGCSENNYHYILSDYTLASLHQDLFTLSTCVLFISLMQLVNSTQFFNIIGLLFSSAAVATVCCASVPSPSYPTTVNCYFTFNKYVCITVIT